MTAKSGVTRHSSHEPDRELPELTDAMLARGHYKKAGKRISRKAGAAAFRKVIGRPRLENPKQAISLRLDVAVLNRWKASGPGWQTRMAESLRQVL
ncbi:MAG: BrnA antitoxin family protein [Pseudomonadota bacterium]